MNQAWASALTQSVYQVFEGLCFMLPQPSVPPPGTNGVALADLPRGSVAVAVEFIGPAEGTLWISVAPSMLAPIASAMLGDDDVESETVQQDALRELANIVCGNVLPLIAGGQAVFDLMSPRILALGEELPSGDANVRVALEEGEVDASLRFRVLSKKGAA
ncbi:MAG: chemotaxis protein CheX [Polyangiaceae bacterium]|nr:chemotaxis protein CheX [Polyangiaceae bacterium]